MEVGLCLLSLLSPLTIKRDYHFREYLTNILDGRIHLALVPLIKKFSWKL
jgi:hypothetical protein